MSMPFEIYSCSRCEFQGWSTVVWGFFSYLDGDAVIPLQRSLGWCEACASLAPVEVLPSAAALARLEAASAAAAARLQPLLAAARRRQQRLARLLGWPLRLDLETAAAEAEFEQAQRELAEARARAAALRARSSGPRCLHCGSHACVPLPPSAAAATGAPASVGMAHPGCGGELLRQPAGFRVAAGMTSRYYDLEGRLVRLERA